MFLFGESNYELYRKNIGAIIMDNLEEKMFYRLVKVSYVLLIGILTLISIYISSLVFEGDWIKVIMVLIIGGSLSYLIPTLIKQLLLYIVYGRDIVYYRQSIAAIKWLRSKAFRVLEVYPKISYLSGICVLSALAFYFQTDLSFSLVGIWFFGYPLIKLILLCKNAFIDKNYVSQDKLDNLCTNIVSFAISSFLVSLYTTWKDPDLHYIFEIMLKCTWNFICISYGIYIIWLTKKSLINKDRQAFNDLCLNLIAIALGVILFYLYEVIKNTNFHLWHFKSLTRMK